MNAEQYANYLMSAQWRAKRLLSLLEHGHRCQMCGCTTYRRGIDVHHFHYKNVGKEELEDIIPLCVKHHELIHNQPEGYTHSTFLRLKRECDEDHWNDPVPSEAQRALSSAGFEPLPLLCPQCFGRTEAGGMGENSDRTCQWCGFGMLSQQRKEKTTGEKNADFLGFTEAKVFHETKDTWKKI